MKYTLHSQNHLEAHTKPDKQFSILPTINKIVGDVNKKTVLVLGIAEGIIANNIAKKSAKKVICIESDKSKLARVKQVITEKNVEIIQDNFFEKKIPKADVIVLPFTLNFIESLPEVKKFLKKVYEALPEHGKLVGVLDLPNRGSQLKRFGSIKKLKGKEEDGTEINVQLFKDSKLIAELVSIYYTQTTIKKLLQEVGFNKILWPQSEISIAGIKKFGNLFWKDYVENSGLGYFWAQK